MEEKDMLLEEISEENVVTEAEDKTVDTVVIDDSENETETLDKGVKSENIFKDKENAEKKDKIKKIKNVVFKTVVGVAFAASLVVIGVALRAAFFHPSDDENFVVDNPEDPNSYSNVAMAIEEDNIIPVYKFSVQGDYNAIDSEDIYSEYHFNLDPTGYFEGHSSAMEDDYGTWDMTSDGEDYYIVITCTDVEDKYKLEINNDGIIMLSQKDKTYTLTPKMEG